MVSARTLIALAAALASLVVPSVAAAHANATPKSDSVRVEPGEISVSFEYSLPPVEADRLRRIYDANRDGRLEGAELDGARRWIEIAATHFLRLELDGRALTPRLDASAVVVEGLEDAQGEVVFRAVERAAVALDAGAHELALRDRHEDPRVDVPVRVALVGGLVAAPGVDTTGVVGPERAALAVGFRAP